MDERVTNTEKRKLFRERRVERDASCLLFVHSDCVSFPLSVVFYSSLRGLSSFPTSLRPFLLWTRVRFYHIGTQMCTINILIPRTAACLDDLLLNFQPGFFFEKLIFCSLLSFFIIAKIDITMFMYLRGLSGFFIYDDLNTRSGLVSLSNRQSTPPLLHDWASSTTLKVFSFNPLPRTT